jgi:hypothetical protein
MTTVASCCHALQCARPGFGHVESAVCCNPQAADAASRLAEGEDPDAAQLPPGTVEFNIQPPQLTAALAEDSLAVDAAPDIDVPDALLPQERLDELLAQRQPAYVPLPGATAVSCCCCCILFELADLLRATDPGRTVLAAHILQRW